MALYRVLTILMGVIVTSCYFFPFMVRNIPFFNSKMLLALVGLAILIYRLSKSKGNVMLRDFIVLTLWAFSISLVSFFTTTLHHTRDNTFFTYFMSMWVWLGGAYGMVIMLKSIHGRIGVRLVFNYLLAVCVLQCILALIFDSFPAANEWSEATFTGEAYMGADTGERLHGIGCALDVAGLRFSAVLCMLAFFLMYSKNNINFQSIYTWTLILGFILLIVIGNQISRTTTVGGLIAISYWVLLWIRGKLDRKTIRKMGIAIVIAIPIITGLYHTDGAFQKNFRFGFEGFFSLVETGKWETNSNSILEDMWVFPDNVETWLIGDGYADNPTDKEGKYYDPYYIGPSYKGFYMNTDIGYCRYIFYFGLIGLLMFSMFMIKTCSVCCKRFPQYSALFIMILIMNFIGWTKVSTDLFMAFAPFLCISRSEDEEFNNSSSLIISKGLKLS